MPTYRAGAVELDVFTFKTGMLAKAAHDLKLRAEKVEVDIDIELDVDIEPGDRRLTDEGSPVAVRLRCDPRSLKVVSAMREGREAPGVLSRKDTTEIERTMGRSVLHPNRFGDITFESTAIEAMAGDGPRRYRIRGRLTLHGVTRSIETVATQRGDAWTTEVALNQPDYDIKPYSALLGSLKVQPRVMVNVRVRTGE